jgi:hypothetical protein
VSRIGNRNGAGKSIVEIAELHGSPSPGKAGAATEQRELRLISRGFQASGTVTRDAAQSIEIADGSVDSSVARFLN